MILIGNTIKMLSHQSRMYRGREKFMFRILIGDREYIDKINQDDYGISILVLVCLYRIMGKFSKYILYEIYKGDTGSLFNFILLTPLSGIISGICTLYISSYIIYFISKKIGGVASYKQMRIAFGVSRIPEIVSLVTIALIYVIFGITKDLGQYQSFEMVFSEPMIVAAGYINFIGVVISMISMSMGIARFNKFSIKKGFLVSIAPMLVLSVLAILVTWIFVTV